MKLKPNVTPREPKLEFDWPAIHIGTAWYEEGPTGCTVFHFPDQARTVADVRGGNHASLLMDNLENGQSDYLDAICFTGGSIFGLEAVTGVNAELLAKGGYKNRKGQVIHGNLDKKTGKRTSY